MNVEEFAQATRFLLVNLSGISKLVTSKERTLIKIKKHQIPSSIHLYVSTFLRF